VKTKSDRKKLRDKIGAMHLKILKFKRGNKSEFTGKTNVVLGRFHILPVSLYPRLEFNDENVLICEWFGVHYDWHHNFYKAKEIEKRIIELRGECYEKNLKKKNAVAPKLDMFRLRLLYIAYQQALKEIGDELL